MLSSRHPSWQSARKPLGVRLNLEELEDLSLLAPYLYVDFGDNFAGGVLNTTIGALSTTKVGSNPAVDGPIMPDPNGLPYAANKTVAITNYNTIYGASAAQNRANIMQYVRRQFEGFNVNVVELTSTPQTTVDGFTVQGATSVDDISVTLGLNENLPQNNDAYIIVGKYIINGNDNPVGRYGGIASGTDIGNFNNNDGTAFVMLGNTPFIGYEFTANTITHEAGHSFGIIHTYNTGGPTIPLAYNPLYESDVMSYLSDGYSFFPRYPMTRGDSNNNYNVLSTPLAASPADQFIIDPNIGPSPLFTYVTGTGAEDIITITRENATQARVQVTAYRDSNYLVPVQVPGQPGVVTYTYLINLDRSIIIDAGKGNDRIEVAADLGVSIRILGNEGRDNIVITGISPSPMYYQPGFTPRNGTKFSPTLDGHPDWRGTITIGSTQISFQELESNSRLTFNTPGQQVVFVGTDKTETLTLQPTASGLLELNGTFNGGTNFVPVQIVRSASLIVNGAGGTDTLAWTDGAGNDTANLHLVDLARPFASLTAGWVGINGVETFTYNGGAGTNNFSITDDYGIGFGSANNPTAGFVHRPTSATAGSLGNPLGISINYSNVNGTYTINGDGSGSGNRSMLSIIGVSGSGLASTTFSELTASNGNDVINVSDRFVSVQNQSLGELRSVTIGTTNGVASLSRLYVFAGNESTGGDFVTATPSSELILYIDGGDPTLNTGVDQIRVTVDSLVPTVVRESDFITPVERTAVLDPTSFGKLEFWNFEIFPSGRLVRTTVAIAPGFESGGIVQVYSPTLTPRYSTMPFDDFSGDIHTAVADFNGDGIGDVIVAAGPGGGPRVKIMDGLTGAVLYDLLVFEQNFRGGVWVAGADFNGDKRAELVVAAGPGGGPRVRIIDMQTLTDLHDFMAFELNFSGGTQVAVGDFNADGVVDLILAAGPGGGPRVIVRNGSDIHQVISDVFVFEQSFRGGVNIAVGDVDGDGYADLIVGRGDGLPHVRVFIGKTMWEVANFYVNDTFAPSQFSTVGNQKGVRVGVADLDQDGFDDVITGRGPGTRSTVRNFRIAALGSDNNPTPAFGQIGEFNPFGVTATNGVFIG